MCNLGNGAYVNSPKNVGEQLEAGCYAFNDDGTPVTSVVYLKGYNSSKGWKTFAQTTPDTSTGWAGMPLITLTSDMVETWSMSFQSTDKNGNNCGAGPFELVVKSAPSSGIFTLQVDKTKITLGDTVTFSGTYNPNSVINIFVEELIRTHIIQISTDSYGKFTKSVQINYSSYKLPATLQIGACTAGGGTYECAINPDKSNYVYIDVSLPSGGALCPNPQLLVNGQVGTITVLPEKDSTNALLLFHLCYQSLSNWGLYELGTLGIVNSTLVKQGTLDTNGTADFTISAPQGTHVYRLYVGCSQIPGLNYNLCAYSSSDMTVNVKPSLISLKYGCLPDKGCIGMQGGDPQIFKYDSLSDCETANPTCKTKSESGCPSCDLTKNYCILNNCIPKEFALYGAVAFFALMLMRK